MMTIKHGKFYKDGVQVPIEHGNKEQIVIMKRIEEMQDGFDPEISIKKKITMQFKCVCGAKNDFDSFTELDENDPDFLIRGETDKCYECGLYFKVTEFRTPHGEYLQLKLIPDPNLKPKKS